MELKRSYDQLLKQEQRITASLIQGLNMLSLPTQALYQYLVELAMSNPFLEIPDPPDLYGQETQILGNAPGRTRIDRGYDTRYYGPEQGVLADDEIQDPFYSYGVSFEGNELLGSLKLQLSMCNLPPAEHAVGLEILGNLDDRGFFVGDLNTICLLYYVSQDTGERILKTIQSFSPKGIAARNVYEALFLQVEDSFSEAELSRKIILEDLQAVCDGAVKQCSKKYKTSPERIEKAFDYIRTLDPRPGNCDTSPCQVQYIQPDIIVRRQGEELQIYIAGETDAPLRLDNYYLSLIKEPGLSAEERLYLRTCLNNARSLIHSVDIRRQTIHRMALSLISMQGDFFRYGPKALHPLTMQQLADEMGMNVSTVSRVVQDKYIATPYGIFPLKYFFIRALHGTDDSFVSANRAKQRIQELIERESPAEPLTDDAICKILEQENICISRRTVSKYRQAAGIPGYVKRKRRG